MIPLTKLKKEVQFNNELAQFVDVLKGIAANRFHVLERQLSLFLEKYADAAEGFLTLTRLPGLDHPFLKPEGDRVGVVMVTSDAGFLGGLNTQVVSAGLKAGGSDPILAVVGERGAGALRELRREFTPFPGIQDATRLSLAFAIRDHAIRQVLSGRCGRIVVSYPRPISFAVQEVAVDVLLPCAEWVSRADEKPLAPHSVFESRPEDVVEYVVIQWLGHWFNEIFALSRLAELAARVIHMEGSYQELLRRGKKLRHEYFRARHEVIDRSMREIFAAQLLKAKQEEPVHEC